MSITRENYEAYFLDYYEGSLTESQVSGLMDFLSQNPDLKEEFEAFEMVTLNDSAEVNLTGKDFLKKPETHSRLINSENFEEYCIASVEGDLNASENAAVMEFMSGNPELEKTYRLYQNTRLSHTEEMDFPDRYILKKLDSGAEKEEQSITYDLEQAIIAYHEGDLDEQEKEAVFAHIHDDTEAAIAFSLYSKTHLQPEELIYPEKQILKKHVISPFARPLYYYAAAAAVLLFMVSLFFLLPQPEGGPQLADTEMLPPAPEESVNEESPAMQDTPAPVAEPQDVIPVREKTPAPDANPVMIRFPEPLLAAQIAPSPRNPFDVKANVSHIEERDEFAYWSLSGSDYLAHYSTEDESPSTDAPQREYVSLASLAAAGVERTTGIDVTTLENPLAKRNYGFWDLAGVGLASIGQLTNTSLTVDKEHDENGRITMLAIGDRFRISR